MEHYRAKKHLGQNFLVNPAVVDRIVEAAEITADDRVVEVGPGPGVLTRALAPKVRELQAIELDDDLLPNLQKLAEDHPNLHIIHADALKTDLPKSPYKVVANIPYYITSPLLNHFLRPKSEREHRPELMVVMVQKEVAEKVCAKTGDHSVLSLQVQIFGEPKLVMTVGKGNFRPQPKVDSAVLLIRTYPKPLIQSTEAFFKLIHAAFSQKRKTLLNSLQHGLRLPKENIVNLLSSSEIPENERPQNLSLEQWSQLTEALHSFARKKLAFSMKK